MLADVGNLDGYTGDALGHEKKDETSIGRFWPEPRR